MDIKALTDEIRAASEHVPFGHSVFQTVALTPGGEGGAACPERRARSLLLNMDAKLLALEEARFRRAELAIDLEEIAVKLAGLTVIDDPHGFGRRRLEIDRDRKTSSIDREDKLIRDALAELEAMHAEWRSLPPVTSRAQFEQAEPAYWARRLWADAQREITAHGAPSPGTLATLGQMGLSVGRVGADWQIAGPQPLIAALPQPAPQPDQITEIADVR